MFKKIILLTLSIAMVGALLSGCAAKPAATPAPTPTAVATSDTVKTGLAVISSIEKSKDPVEKVGLAQTDSTVVAVTVDKDGKIVKCMIDAAQTKIDFSEDGKIITDLKLVGKSKQELGAEYGMAKASKIKKEWNEEANALAAYVVGKTVAEVKGIAVNAEGVPTDAELASSVTLKIGGFVSAIEKAVANAQDLGAKSSDKLGLGINTNIAKSVSAGAEPGLAQAYSYYTVVTFDASGKITSTVIDASQSNVNFTKAGKITSDLKAALKTKNELGAEYGMLKASKIKKEWNEQAATFAKYVTGKTLAEVKGIAVKEGVPTGSDLTGSVTVHITDFTGTIEKASVNAK